MLATFLRTGGISAYFEPVKKYYKNICYLKSARVRVNTDCCERFVKNKKHQTVNLKYNRKKESYIFV